MTAVVALLVAAAIGWTPPAQAERLDPADEAAIRSLVSSYADARDRQSPEMIRPLFTADADQLVSSGEWRRGREALVQGMLASSARSGGKRTLVVETVRMVASGVALADARYEIIASTSDVRRMWSTFVMAKAPDGWRIAAIRNMLPAPPSPAAPR